MPLECLIIGAGPAGLSLAKTLQDHGLRPRIYDKGPIGSHIFQYPTFMRFHSTRENVSLPGLPLTIPEDKPTRQQYVSYLAQYVRHFNLDVQTYAEVIAVQRDPGSDLGRERLRCRIRRPGGNEETVEALTVVAAVGAWEHPRRLRVPGDDLPKVHYRFLDVHPYVGARVAVVGGRNSALEVALAIWRAGAEVTLIHRGDHFQGRGVKYWLAPDMENRIAAGEIRAFLKSGIHRIDWGSITVRTETGELVTIGNDFVVPQIGYHPPIDFLRELGLEVTDAESRPVVNEETFESNIPGLFVAGVIAAGDVSGHIFIENAKYHGDKIAPRVKEIVGRVAMQ